MKEPETATTTRMTMIFGTKVSVTSWIWVRAWISAMMVPTSIAAPTAGPEATMMVQIAAWTMSRASRSFMTG